MFLQGLIEDDVSVAGVMNDRRDGQRDRNENTNGHRGRDAGTVPFSALDVSSFLRRYLFHFHSCRLHEDWDGAIQGFPDDGRIVGSNWFA